ncbi:MAG: tripartite tricarboxylate transporter TctB family protein [Thermodesulfobacteriota bacterium]
MLRDDAFAAGLFLVFVVVLGIEAFNYPIGGSLRKVGPGFFPLVCLAFLAVFSGILLILSARDWHLNLRAHWPRSFTPAIIVLLSIFAYGFVLPWLGFLLTTFFFSLVLFWRGYPRRWLLTILGAAITSLLAVLVFEIWLKIQFPRGLIGI